MSFYNNRHQNHWEGIQKWQYTWMKHKKLSLWDLKHWKIIFQKTNMIMNTSSKLSRELIFTFIKYLCGFCTCVAVFQVKVFWLIGLCCFIFNKLANFLVNSGVVIRQQKLNIIARSQNNSCSNKTGFFLFLSHISWIDMTTLLWKSPYELRLLLSCYSTIFSKLPFYLHSPW